MIFTKNKNSQVPIEIKIIIIGNYDIDVTANFIVI